MRNYDDEVRTFGEDHAALAEHGSIAAYQGMPLTDVLHRCWVDGYRLGAASFEALSAGYSVPLRQIRAAFEEFDADRARIEAQDARDAGRWARYMEAQDAERGNRGLQR